MDPPLLVVHFVLALVLVILLLVLEAPVLLPRKLCSVALVPVLIQCWGCCWNLHYWQLTLCSYWCCVHQSCYGACVGFHLLENCVGGFECQRVGLFDLKGQFVECQRAVLFDLKGQFEHSFGLGQSEHRFGLP